MRITSRRFHALQVIFFVLVALMPAAAQSDHPDYSGMYSFLREGEFVQITVEDQGRVIGFVSRYADAEGEGGFVEHFFRSGKLAGNRLEFTTETVNGVWFEFRGTIERGDGHARGDEGYYVLKGTVVENVTGKDKKTSTTSHSVSLESFPQDVAPRAAQQK
jgi:hypothetical protein